MLIAYLSAIVCLVGLLMFALSANAKVSAIGKDMFWVGLLITLYASAGHVVTIGR